MNPLDTKAHNILNKLKNSLSTWLLPAVEHKLSYIIDWLVVWVSRHINICKLFNAKSIFMKILLFQTIQLSVSTQFKCKYKLIVKNIFISSYSV